MMATKKVSRMRGRRTHGWGSPKKHRGAGSRGGIGMAGSEKHKKTYLLKKDPDYGIKKGFKSKSRSNIKSVNLRNLQKMAGSEKKIDASAMGYDKVLATGEVKAKLEVKADYFSASAKRKIEEAGGKAIGTVSGEAEEKVQEEPVEGSQEEAVEKGS